MLVKLANIAPKEYEEVACTLCGASDTKLLAKEGQFGWPTYVSVCRQCGLVYLNPRWTKDGYLTFYANEYDNFYRFDEDKATEKELRKTRIVWERLQAHTTHKINTVLDIGCGLGWSLHYLSQQIPGLSIAGIEPSDYCADHLTNQIGGELVARDVDSDWHISNQGRFDLIIVRHVLEHLLDPLEALQKVHQALSPSGIVYMGVPDMMHPDGPLADFWFRCVHTYYYSEHTLRSLALRSGLAPITIKSENSELWAIFQKDKAQVAPVSPLVYRQQVESLNEYRRKRRLREFILLFSPHKLSRLVPKAIKERIPQSYKDKFRQLVYRH